MDNDEPSKILQGIGLILLAISPPAALLWFFYDVVYLFQVMYSLPPTISFNKGVMYLLGCGTLLGLFLVITIWERIIKGSVPDGASRWFSRIIVVALLITFILPHAVHYPLDNYLKGKGYKICETVSYQWFVYHEMIYTDSFDVCQDLIKRQEERRASYYD